MARTISASTKYGVLLHGTDSPVTVAQGVTVDTSGSSAYGLYSTSPVAMYVQNLGSVTSRSAGISLAHADTVTNGSVTDTSAFIRGSEGIEVLGPGALIQNFASIYGSVGVYLVHGGNVTNGSAADHTAVIYGDGTAVLLGGSGTVANDAEIFGYVNGVDLAAGGTVDNGLASASALISSFGGSGVVVDGGQGCIINGGTITGSPGSQYPSRPPPDYAYGAAVLLNAGGTVTNGISAHASAKIAGIFVGIEIAAGAGTVINTCTVSGLGALYYYTGAGVVATFGTAVTLASGGMVVNGSFADPGGALIAGGRYGVAISGQAGTVRNAGTVSTGGKLTIGGDAGNSIAYFGASVTLAAGGTVVNGSPGAATSALIVSENVGVAISGEPGIVRNYSTISGANAVDAPLYDQELGTGVALQAGGRVVNGSTASAGARISANAVGVQIAGGFGVVDNDGTIIGTASYVPDYYYTAAVGVEARAGGRIDNGVFGVGSALISGPAYGVLVSGGPGIVINAGTITSAGPAYSSGLGTGIALQAGGRVVNGSTASTGARISANAVGVQIAGGYGVVHNDGTIIATASYVSYKFNGGIGVEATAGGRIDNGVSGVGSALISGVAFGVLVSGGPGIVINAGTITSAYRGVELFGGPDTVINSGTITGGDVGVFFGLEDGSAKLTNTGTISGSGADRVTAVVLDAGSNTLAIGAGAVFHGTVDANPQGINTLQLLAGPAGTVSGIGSEYLGFQTLAVVAGAYWSVAGVNAAGADFGVALRADASLEVTGSLNVGSVLTLQGRGTLGVAAAGQLVVGGTAGAAGVVTVEREIVGSGTIATSIADSGSIVASGGTLTLGSDTGGTGTVAISAHSVLQADAGLSTARVEFLLGSGEKLALAEPKRMSSQIIGFARGDRIDLLGTVATSLSFSSATDILTVRGAGGAIAALRFSSSYGALRFQLASDGHGGSNILLN